MATSTRASAAQFAPTRWSVVLAAGDCQDGTSARDAMELLARSYWFPLYAYLRRRGHSPSQAEDLVQGFFAHLLEKGGLATVDRAKGKFRSFLLASLKHFVSDEWDKARAQKRSAGAPVIALDSLDAEARYAIEPADDMAPERLFERRWAYAVLDQVLERLRQQYADRGQLPLFDALKGHLTSSASHADIACDLNMSTSALAVAAHRLRRRYRELLRDEIAQTVSTPELVDEEIRYLMECL